MSSPMPRSSGLIRSTLFPMPSQVTVTLNSPLQSSSPNSIAIPLPVLSGIITLLVAAIVAVAVLIFVVWFVKHKNAHRPGIDNRPKLPPPYPERPHTITSVPPTVRYSYLEVCSEGIYDEILQSEELIMLDPSLLHSTSSRGSSSTSHIIQNANGYLTRLENEPGYLVSNPTYSSQNNSWLGVYCYSEPVPSDDDSADFAYCEPLEASMSAEDLLFSCASIYDDPLPLTPQESPLEIKPQNIVQISKLGMGQFGEVMLAKTIGLSLKSLKLSETDDNESVTVLVAVKKLRANAGSMKEAFEREIKFMSRLNHDNIIRLLGVCLEDPEQSFIVMEYMENGDLGQYLRDHSTSFQGDSQTSHQMSQSVLLFMALQIAHGMKYLASLHFIHRDLATRNCLVGARNVVKVADFGLSRSLYSSYYYKVRGKALLPIRWMATECFYGRFSEKSDVWAFGMTMWEIFTFAKRQPLLEMTNQEVIVDAIRGPERKVPQRPEHCPGNIYRVMQRCWEHEPDERATFEELYSSLSKLHANLKWIL